MYSLSGLQSQLHPLFQLSLPSEEPAWKRILQSQLVPTSRHLSLGPRHCGAEKEPCLFPIPDLKHNKMVVVYVLSIRVVCYAVTVTGTGS